jgi:hypothetical protein
MFSKLPKKESLIFSNEHLNENTCNSAKKIGDVLVISYFMR